MVGIVNGPLGGMEPPFVTIKGGVQQWGVAGALLGAFVFNPSATLHTGQSLLDWEGVVLLMVTFKGKVQ